MATPAWAASNLVSQTVTVRQQTDASVYFTQLLTDDSQTSRHLTYSEVRATGGTHALFGVDKLQLQVDGRARLGWTGETPNRAELSRLFLRYGDRKTPWRMAVGRQVISYASGARVDGGHLELGLGKGVFAGVYGGLRPHPLTGRFDSHFSAAGFGYDARSAASNHAGGLGSEWFGSEIDRLFVTERIYLRFGQAWSLYGNALVDFLAPHGIVDEFKPRNTNNGSLSGIDPTRGQLRLRYVDRALGDVSMSLLHAHAILPNRWWQNWMREERARHGFVVDGLDPVGTRRSTARLTTNWYLSREIKPYLVLRYDRRHGDNADGYQVRTGLKVILRAMGYLNVAYSYRDYFGTLNHTGTITAGRDIIDGVSVDAELSAVYAKPSGTGGHMLWDFNSTVTGRLDRLSASLKNVDAMLEYQGFYESGLIYNIFFARLGYRFRS